MITKIPKFRRCIIQNFPFIEEDFDALTDYGLVSEIVEYLNKVIDSTNSQTEVVEEYTNKFIELKSYVDHYFDNLDVTEEINNKLDQMAEDGTLSELIARYIDPIQTQFETEVNAKLDSQDADIANINTKVERAISGNPLPADTVEDMTDTSRIYVLVTTGEWYYYDGEEWTSGGTYQSPVANYDTTLTATNGVADSKSIGDRINTNFYINNLIDVTDCQDNKTYNASGEIVTNSNRCLFNNVIPVKEGDILRNGKITDSSIALDLIGDVIKVDCYGNFIEILNSASVNYYTIPSDGFIKIAGYKPTGADFPNKFYYLNTISTNYTSHAFNNKNSEDIKSINKNLELNGTQYNYLDIDSCVNNQNLDANGNVIYSSNGFSVTNLIPVKNGDVIRFYNFNQSGTYRLIHICEYDTNKHFISRASVTNNTITVDFDGYIMGNVSKPTSANNLGDCDISINQELTKHYQYGIIIAQTIEKKVRITKIDSRNYLINFGNFNVTLYKTENSTTNANNWNLKTVKRGDNVIVPEGTDIIGPVRINQNTDFIGGVHGDETTTSIILCADGNTYKDSNISNINVIDCDKLTITLISNVYDQVDGDIAFTRNVIVTITDNKIECSNSFIAAKNLTLRTACTGGLIACHNSIINNITLNNKYYDSAPTYSTSQETLSKDCTYAVIDTIYGSIIANNIKGYDNPNYEGFLTVYTNETPMRSKVYFEPYYNGSYGISTGDIITGQFEYIFN